MKKTLTDDKNTKMRIMKFILLHLLFFSTSALGQRFGFYKPDGSYIGDLQRMSMNDVNKKLGIIKTYIFTSSDTDENSSHTIGFKMLSNKPAWILSNIPQKIDSLVALFDYDEYKNSYRIEMDIESLIKIKALTDSYLINNLGKPSKTIRSSDSKNTSEIWSYSDMGLDFYLTNHLVRRYTRVNN